MAIVSRLPWIRDLLPSTTPTGDLFYLVGLENQPVIDLLRQLYPTAQLRAEPTDRVGPTLFLVIQIPLVDVLNHQGLAGRYFAGTETIGDPVETRLDGPLRFAWSSNPPLAGPFSVLWEGSLLVPDPGTYTFAIDTSATGPDAPVISLQLDGNLVLDSSLGLVEKAEVLAQGAYQFTLRYRATSAASDWALRWTPPGGAPGDLARTQLYSPALPNIGLIGTYYAGSNWDGPVLTTRKELVLGAPVDLPPPYSIDWTGKLAAARAGVEMGNVHIFDFYRDALGAIREEGLARFLRRVATPYVSRAVRHFDPRAGTYTERFLAWLQQRRHGAAS